MLMKKILFLAAIASVALTSCVKEEANSLEQQANRKIAFDSPVLYSNEDSRANVYGEIGSHTYVSGGVVYSYPREENFVIYAVSHETNFAGWSAAAPAEFNNTAIAYDNDLDGWAPKTATDGYYYWDSSKKMSFAASSPADLEQANWGGVDKRSYGANGLIITDFEVNADAAHQYDLLFSTRICNKTAADMNHSASYYSGIPIQFQHALTSVRFSIANSSTETVVLTGVTVKGVKYKGTFNENITEDAADYTRYDKTPTTGNVNPAWTVADDMIATPYVAFTGSINFRSNPRYVSELVAEKKASEPTATDICHQLLLMPQVLTEAAEVTVEYTVNGTPNSKTVKLKDKQSQDQHGTITGTIGEWEMGKRYTYRLYYSSETADRDKIYFAPSTDEWTDVDVIVINL